MLSSLFDLSFENFITLQLTKYIYIFMIIGAVLSSIGILSAVSSATNIVLGLLAFAISLTIMIVFARLIIETMVVLFKIAENTGKMARNSR